MKTNLKKELTRLDYRYAECCDTCSHAYRGKDGDEEPKWCVVFPSIDFRPLMLCDAYLAEDYLNVDWEWLLD